MTATPLKSLGDMKRDALRELFAAAMEARIMGDIEGTQKLKTDAKAKGLSDGEIHWVTEELAFDAAEYKKVFGALEKPLQQKLKEFDEVQPFGPFFKGFYPDPKLH
jgi:hypothetical protein